MRAKALVSIVSVVGIAAVVLAPAAFAQGMKWRGSGGWGPGTAYGRIYDVKTVETVSGEVVKVDRITPMRGMAYGVHLVVKTDKGDVSVHLGPQWYLENQDVKIEPKDRVEVKARASRCKGSRRSLPLR